MKDWRLKNHDWIMTALIFMLMFIGLVVIYSATFSAQSEIEGVGTINRQLVFAILGFSIYFVVSRIDPSFYRFFPIQVIIVVITVGLLLYVWLLGDPVRNTNRWIEWGFIRIQPSEYAKIALILLNASVLSDVLQQIKKDDVDWGRYREKAKNIKGRIKAFGKNFTSFYPTLYRYALAVIISAVVIVLVLVEPALGNASIITFICVSLFLFAFPRQQIAFGLIFIGLLIINAATGFINFGGLYDAVGINLMVGQFDVLMIILSAVVIVLIVASARINIIAALVVAGLSIFLVIASSYAWDNVLRGYQKSRIETFLNPEKDTQGAAWQLQQSKIAIGSGRLFGKGFLQGSQSKLRYLPEAYTDFIFAAYAEEFGLVGSLVLLVLYILLFTRIIRAAIDASDYYKSLICIGVLVMIFVHVFINTGMNMGILPITGIPLPLISYGGSSVMVTMIALGLVQAVNTHKDIVDMQGDLVLTSKSVWRGN